MNCMKIEITPLSKKNYRIDVRLYREDVTDFDSIIDFISNDFVDSLSSNIVESLSNISFNFSSEK